MTTQTEKTLATHGALKLVMLVPSGCRVVTDGKSDSHDLPQHEVDAIVADPSLMMMLDREPRVAAAE